MSCYFYDKFNIALGVKSTNSYHMFGINEFDRDVFVWDISHLILNSIFYDPRDKIYT